MTDIAIMIIITLGALFVLFAALGIVRMPDLYLRISVTTKAATLGVGMILIGAAMYFNEASITTRALAIVFFLILTAPVGAHLIGNTSYYKGVPLWNRSKVDDLKNSSNGPPENEVRKDEPQRPQGEQTAE
ncbi:monovalent cation/H(+) antiporter subunit G [Membranicola marinus]|uniref:Monovalent cation/H(+) antiporter subunit G n=1 Tax=Membranihabitans marinus TaxID=1227546 RepID=A0A953HP50_9BACT|nr:monovalent cation/H(+) antiporter subunit G [Membranihabitans marinus]MBY5958208.1 monovalent cation/H(+) antiporter subunit G [Membranihabitans marinus]